jgi:glycosyltransferase involved in cell wall biosynthesis
MRHATPTITFLTTARWGGSYPRVARWLRAGFRSIDTPYDAVFLEGPRRVEDDGLTRSIYLGKRSSAEAFVPFLRYAWAARPVLTLVKPPSLAIPAIAAGRVARCSVTTWEPSFKRQETDTAPRYRRLYFGARHAAYRSAPVLAAVSDDVGAALRTEFPSYPGPIVTIDNPIDADEVRRRSQPTADRSGGLEFCAVGRMAAEKGYDVLLDAFARASGELGRAWRLRILGKGPRLDEVRMLAQRLGIADHVEFMGWVDNPYPIMAAADVLVHAARFEPFGLVYTEALSLGVPVVATDCPGGPSRVFQGGKYGVLTPNEDAATLASAIVDLANDADRRDELAKNGLERVKDYAPEIIAARLAALARSLEEAPRPDRTEQKVGDIA